ncbi:MAG: D-isomer-specific 2-hydroxyacid dehydrogenase NAD-binding protein [Monoraphidium minutum]|nr:MAG: D-isomer-specific 2-hydroxyacid dehydrogenase NAD-binding protein [Monoraphidium minutum]
MRIMVFSAKPYVEKYFIARLKERGFENVRHTEARLDRETALIARGCEAVSLFVNDECDAQAVRALAEGGVKFIAMRCAGYDRVDVAAAREAGIRVARVPTYSPTSVAEHAVALMFALERRVANAAARVAQGNYALSGLVGRQVFGKTCGVLGTGAIGTEACRIFKGLGMRVLAYDIKPNPKVEEMGIPYLPWEEILPQADVVSLHVPLLPSTRHFMDVDKVFRMKPGATLLNVSRGGLLDSDALLEGLRSGHLGGVGLDVYENEGSLFFQDWTSMQARDRMKFWDRRFKELVAYPQVLVTPHTAFLTNEALEAIAATTMDNLTEYALGLPLTNEVAPSPPSAR